MLGLLVDDRRDCCKTMAIPLRAFRIPIATAYCGREATKKAKELRPDFILLDTMMDDMDGWEVAQVLRKEASLGTKVFALSSYSGDFDKQRGKEVGMDHHFTKPLEMDEFWRIMRQHGLAA